MITSGKKDSSAAISVSAFFRLITHQSPTAKKHHKATLLLARLLAVMKTELLFISCRNLSLAVPHTSSLAPK